ncbi:sensor histidine kinase [Brevundimonas sp.]|uniref:sensor histidine kinase n=1 Tax=Brevundimonas sp. TaxID=1871086 RepID=UPI002FC91C75
MISALRPTLLAFGRFLRTSSLSRSVVSLLAGAIALLLIVNIGVFVMLQRTSDFNDSVEKGQRIRLVANEVMTLSVDAETGQRGFLLTGQVEYLEPYNTATAQLPDHLDELAGLTAGDPDLSPRVERLQALSQQRLDIIDRTIALGRMGRFNDGVRLIRDGSGKVLMDQMRAETAAINEIQATRLQFGTRQTEWASGATVLVNALAAVLIVTLAGISGWLIRRYVIEMQEARDALDAMNAGLEQRIRDRTFELTRANEEIQRFAYIVSHDLRAPLVNVMGYTSELEQAGKVIDAAIAAAEKVRKVDPGVITAVREDVPEAIGFIRASTEKMDRLINAILKLSREGRRVLVPEMLDMTAMAQGVADSVRHQTEASDAEILIERLPGVESDRLSMEQILGNLVDNAVKYLDPARPGRIVVSGAETGDGWVVYRIADNGRGISERDHERIFELFRRSGKQDRAGEGLGLAFVRNSVRRLGGDITVESELGKGSTFMLKFPTRLVLADAGDY